MRFKPSLLTTILLLLFIWCTAQLAVAQGIGAPPPIKDMAELKQMPASADKTMHLLRYARHPKTVYSDDLKTLLEEALQNAKDLKRDDLIANTLATLAITELGQGHQELALSFMKQAETYQPKLPDQLVVSQLSDFSRIYTRMGDQEKMILYYDKIEAFTKDKPQFYIPRILNFRNRSNLELRNGNYEKVKQNYEMALQLSKQSNNPSILKDTRFSYANVLINMQKEAEAFAILKDLIPDLDNNLNDRTAQFFEILSRNYESTGDYKNAFLYADKAYNLPTTTAQQKSYNINRMLMLSFWLKNYENFDTYFAAHKKYGMDANSLHSKKSYQLAESRYYDAKNRIKLAKNNYLKAYGLKLNKQAVPALDVEILTGLASLYNRTGNKDSAAFYFKKAESILKKIPLSPATRLLYANAWKEANQDGTTSNQDTLIKSLEQQIHLKDTLYQMALRKATGELETKYKVTEKEQQLELAKKQQELQQLELKQQKQRSWFIIIGATVAILLFAGLAYFLFQRKKQASILHQATLSNLKQQHQIELMNTLTEAQEQEKKRIAARLHDEVGAMLSITKLNIGTLGDDVFKAGTDAPKKLEVAQNLLGDISETIRNISHALMPIALEKYGFKAAILDLITSIKTANSLHVEHVIEGFDHTEKWPQQFTLNAYRIIQEILNNAIKHADANHLFIQLIELENAMTIYIEDDGKGIKKENDASGAGMKLLQTNIAYLSGKLEIEGKPNEGTFVLIELPIPNTSLS